MSDEQKNVVIQRGTPRERVKVADDPELLKARIAHLEDKKKTLSDRMVNVDTELEQRKAELAKHEKSAEGAE